MVEQERGDGMPIRVKPEPDAHEGAGCSSPYPHCVPLMRFGLFRHHRVWNSATIERGCDLRSTFGASRLSHVRVAFRAVKRYSHPMEGARVLSP